MNHSERLALKRIEQVLYKKHQRSEQPTVNIREVLVAQSVKSGMNYQPLLGEALTIPPGQKSAPLETSEQLLDRMVNHIQTQVAVANQWHLEDNFTGVEEKTLKPGAEHNITRLSFSEFSFYPSKEQGPLSMSEFNSLIGRIETIAAGYHQNLHLLLSSFPVKDPSGSVHNVVLYVQCGTPPTLSSFAKAVPSEIDVVYPETTNPFFSKGSQSPKESVSQAMNIAWDLNKGKIDNIKRKVSALVSFVSGNLDYPPSQALVDAVNALSAKLEVSEELSPDIRRDIDSVMSMLSAYTEETDQQLMLYRKELVQLSHAATLSGGTLAEPEEPLGWNYGGEVRCETAGGKQFTTAIDICLDHSLSIAKKAFQKSAKHYASNAQGTIPTAAAHVITSNSVHAYQESIISPTVAHADALPSRVGIDTAKDDPFKKSTPFVSEIENTKQSFGFSSLTRVYPPHQVEQLVGTLLSSITAQNNFNIKVDALRQFYLLRPNKLNAINNELIQLAAKEVLSCCNYNHVLTKEELNDTLKNIIKSLNEENLDIRSPSISAVVELETQRIQSEIARSSPLVMCIASLQATAEGDNSKHKQATEDLAKRILDEAVKKCPKWASVNPGEQNKALKTLTLFLLNDVKIDAAKPANIVNLINEISAQLNHAIYKKAGYQMSLTHRGQNEYGIHFQTVLNQALSTHYLDPKKITMGLSSTTAIREQLDALKADEQTSAPTMGSPNG